MSGREIDFSATEALKVTPVAGQSDQAYTKTAHMVYLNNFYAVYHTDSHTFELKSTKVLPYDKADAALAKLKASDQDFAQT